MDDEAFKSRILAAATGEIVELPKGWTMADLVEWICDGNLDDAPTGTASRILFTEAKVRAEELN